MILKVRARARLNPPAIARQASFGFFAVGEINLRLWNCLVQNALEPDIEVEFLEGVGALLKPLGDGKVARFYRDSVVALCGVMGYEQQVCYFVVDELVVTLDVLFVDVQFSGGPEEMLDLVGALDTLVRFEVMHWLEWVRVLSCHFVPPLRMG